MNSRLPTLVELDREIAKRSFAEFCKMAWHVLEPATPLKWGWCLDAICEHLQAVHDGEIKRLLMNVPPGCMKSLTTGVFFPAWEWGAGGRPDLRFLTTAHKETLAIRDNMKCRRLIQSEWFQKRWPITLTGDQNAKTKFENTETGFRESMAFRSLTGSRGDRIIIDDPLSVDDAFSEAALDATEQTFLEAVPSRINNEDSAIIVIMQRLHERDTSGIILSHDLGYTHLMLPMRFEPERRCVTSIGFSDPRTTPGELLFPERFSEAQVSDLEKTMGSYATAGQFQQRPVPRGGGLFKSEWIQHWDKLPERFDSAVISWDMTFKDSDTSDFVVGQVWGKKDGCFYLVDQFRGRWDFVKTLEMFVAAAKKYPRVTRKLVEDKANGSAIISTLKRKVSGIIPITPKESKEARASAVTTLWEARNVFLPPPDRYPWVAEEFIPELLSFPSGAHDDQCFAAGTLIATPLGDRPIESLKAGDYVLTPMGLRRVLAAGMTGKSETITKYGITATKDHPFLTRSGRFKAFCQVKENECFGLTLRQMNEASILILSSSMASRIDFYRKAGITLASQQRTKGGKARKACMLLSGRNTPEKKSLMAGKFTIRTAIRLITNSAILSVYRAANIVRRSISRLKEFVKTLIGLGLLHPLGTKVKPDVLGTGNTRSNQRPNKSAPASVAGRSSSQKELTPSIALGDARSNIATTTMRSQKNAPAWSAGQSSQLSSDRTEKAEQSHAAGSVEPSGEFGSRQPVFNLTVEGAHCFYANGLLVHNCDSMTQALSDLNKHQGLNIDLTNIAYLMRR